MSEYSVQIFFLLLHVYWASFRIGLFMYMFRRRITVSTFDISSSRYVRRTVECAVLGKLSLSMNVTHMVDVEVVGVNEAASC